MEKETKEGNKEKGQMEVEENNNWKRNNRDTENKHGLVGLY